MVALRSHSSGIEVLSLVFRKKKNGLSPRQFAQNFPVEMKVSRVACVLLLAAAGASCSAAEGSPAFAAAPLISRLRGGGMPQFWANQQDLKNAPERWSGGFAKLRAMCGGTSEEEPASRGKASRLEGACGGLCRARVLEDDTRWCMRTHA